MLIKRPIFINGFQRGGTNILQQLFASNPRVRGLGVEVHELFYGRDAQPVQKWLRRATKPITVPVNNPAAGKAQGLSIKTTIVSSRPLPQRDCRTVPPFPPAASRADWMAAVSSSVPFPRAPKERGDQVL